jgi:hypothetical protein
LIWPWRATQNRPDSAQSYEAIRYSTSVALSSSLSVTGNTEELAQAQEWDRAERLTHSIRDPGEEAGALAARLPAAVLAEALNLTPGTAVDWVRAAGGDWSPYAAQVARGVNDRAQC